MKTTTYGAVKGLAAYLARRADDTASAGKLTPAEATSLRAFLAADLPEIWDREAWPELCDHLEAVAVDANKCFSKREGTATEMGDILAVLDQNPLTTTLASTLNYATGLDGRVNLVTSLAQVYVDWQTPCPDLLGTTEMAAGDAYTLPDRFKLPMAARGAAFLLADEDPAEAQRLRSLAETSLNRQAAGIRKPWWRKASLTEL
jgi:hypothetical protein